VPATEGKQRLLAREIASAVGEELLNGMRLHGDRFHVGNQVIERFEWPKFSCELQQSVSARPFVAPDHPVHLELKAHRQVITENPFGKMSRIKAADNRRKQYGTAFRQPARRHD